MTRFIPRALIAILLAGAPLALTAQANAAPGGRPEPYHPGEGWTATLECRQCIVHISPGASWVEFGAEPVLKGKSASGALVDGDVLVSVDRLLITTIAGARKLAQNGIHPMLLTIRREGREIDVPVPGPVKWQFGTNDSIVVGFSPDTGDSAAPQQTEMNVNTTRGWLGIGLSCERCGIDGLDRSRRDHVVRFNTFPFVVAVDPVAAAVAGFKRGDVIKSIDGQSMISAAGFQRFSTLRAGEWVRFLVERSGTLVTLKLLVPKRPDSR